MLYNSGVIKELTEIEIFKPTISFHSFHFMSCALRARNGTSAQSSLQFTDLVW